MKKSYFIIFVLFISGCAASNSTINNAYRNPEFDRMPAYKTMLMPLGYNDLSVKEANMVNSELEDYFKYNLSFVKTVKTEDSKEFLKKKNLTDANSNFWEAYLNSGMIDKGFLKKIGTELNVNTVLYSQVTDVNKVFGIHRKVIGSTTAKLRYTIFSAVTGNLLWDLSVSATQENAFSDQSVPPTIEAVEIAFSTVLKNLPF